MLGWKGIDILPPLGCEGMLMVRLTALLPVVAAATASVASLSI